MDTSSSNSNKIVCQKYLPGDGKKQGRMSRYLAECPQKPWYKSEEQKRAEKQGVENIKRVQEWRKHLEVIEESFCRDMNASLTEVYITQKMWENISQQHRVSPMSKFQIAEVYAPKRNARKGGIFEFLGVSGTSFSDELDDASIIDKSISDMGWGNRIPKFPVGELSENPIMMDAPHCNVKIYTESAAGICHFSGLPVKSDGKVVFVNFKAEPCWN